MNTLSPIAGADRYFDESGAPILFSHGQGPKIFDSDGKDYYDYVCGTGPVVLGHADTEFNRRIAKSLDRGLCFPGYGQPHQELAERFESFEPKKNVVSFFKSSSEAMTSALRCAMLETGRSGLLRCGFLGWHDPLIAKTPFWHEQLDSDRRRENRYTEGFRGVSGSESVFGDKAES